MTTDMAGQPIHVGDYLIDDRGKIFVVEETPPTFAKEMLVRVHALRGRTAGYEAHTYLRLNLVLRVAGGRLYYEDPAALRERWQAAYERYRRAASRAFLAARKAGITGPPRRGRPRPQLGQEV